ncbi:MAG TPA: hypothetical protein VF980_03395, partial [Thermoanaerobaculia bacterium]
MRKVLLAVAVALLVTPLFAQTADEIIAKYVKTIGGADRLQAINTIRRTGKYIGGGGFEAPISQENKRPNKVREEFTFGGLTGVTAYDGRSGWKIEPWQGKKDPEPLGEDELKDILVDAEFDGPLVNYQQQGNKVEYVGMEPVEGTDSYKLRVSSPNGDVRYFYMDADYYVPIRIETQRMIRGGLREYEMTLGDYKPAGGVYFPYSVEVNVKGRQNRQKSVYDRIETNLQLADARFERGAVATASPGAAPTTSATAPPPGSFAVSAAQDDKPIRIDSDTISGLGARNIGSAAMSGRIAAVDAVHEGKRLTIYVGSASGGVWKSTNGGTTYKPVFDKQNVQSIGALAIDRKNPKIVWVGTGESWTRNSVSIGDGIYKTTDGGDTWTNMGLPESERIAKIVIDPADSNTVYACVPGKLWSDSDERGVYRTTDGGKSWTKVLKGANASTGCSMISIDPQNPKTLYAGMWDFRRKGWTFRSGGEDATKPSGSGLFKTTDGGATWQDLSASSVLGPRSSDRPTRSATTAGSETRGPRTEDRGLPPKPWGRVAVTVAPSNPNVVYAFIEAAPPKNALYRSDDGGKTWQMRDRSQMMIWRAFYFANLIVDPKDENKIYKPGGGLIASNDGGKSFSGISGGAHGDFHDVWIDPEDTDHLITGDDGGLWYSYDGANRWWKAENLPVSQFYHVSVDNDMPYHVYGGLQDNSSWVGDSQYPGGITNSRWENMYGGDGFWTWVDPSDPQYLYAEAQGGDMGRVNRKTHEIRALKPLPRYKEGKLRFNWNTPIMVSPSGAVYMGSQFLFRTRDHGQTWDRISPDLTTNDPMKQKQEESGGVVTDNSYAEMHTTIYAIAESPKNRDIVWAGTDDGNVQITRDGGKTWTNVTPNVAGLPKNAWVSTIDAGHFDEGTAYATFDLHTSGDMRPYAYRTTDYGKTWSAVVSPSSNVHGYTHVIREDLANRNLLFLGTEMGLWVSLDGGNQWAQYKGGDLPNVAVRDLVIHPRDNDLVIATHGRGIWIVDDITPLRSLTPENLGKEAFFVQSKPAVQRIDAFAGWVNGDAAFVGPNPPNEAVITYYQRRRHIFGDMKIDVVDADGKVAGTIPSGKRRGLSRVNWGMRLPAPRIPPAATGAGSAAIGPRLLPGTYTVRMTKDQNVYTTPLNIVMDPRVTYSLEDRRAQFALATKLGALLGTMTDAVERINGVRAALDQRAAKLDTGDALVTRLRTASDEADTMRRKIVATKEGGMITGEERLRENLADLYSSVNGYEGPPTQMQIERTDAIARELG